MFRIVAHGHGLAIYVLMPALRFALQQRWQLARALEVSRFHVAEFFAVR